MVAHIAHAAEASWGTEKHQVPPSRTVRSDESPDNIRCFKLECKEKDQLGIRSHRDVNMSTPLVSCMCQVFCHMLWTHIKVKIFCLF